VVKLFGCIQVSWALCAQWLRYSASGGRAALILLLLWRTFAVVLQAPPPVLFRVGGVFVLDLVL